MERAVVDGTKVLDSSRVRKECVCSHGSWRYTGEEVGFRKNVRVARRVLVLSEFGESLLQERPILCLDGEPSLNP